MRCRDSSALVPLLLPEPAPRAVRRPLAPGEPVVVCWTAAVECASAVARREREGILGPAAVSLAPSRLDRLRTGWSAALPGEAVRDGARRPRGVHPPGAADSLQPAAALLAAEGVPSSPPFVGLDGLLRAAAAREGLPIRPE